MDKNPSLDKPTPKARLIEIDRATAIAIILVVIGHIVARQPPADNTWYVALKYYIYKFHMPLFMFLSGTIFYYTFKAQTRLSEFLSWSKKKSLRLAPGFFLFGAIIIFGKIIASYFLHVDNLQTNILLSLYKLLITPIESPGGSLWYIYVLLEFYLLVPLALALFRQNLYLLALFSLALHIINNIKPFPIYFMMDGLAEYLLWFTLGAIAVSKYEFFLNVIQKFRLLFLLLFAISFTLTGHIPEAFSKSIIGLASIPAILSVCLFANTALDKLLLFISSYTYTIYLMNTLTIGLTKGLMLKVFPWDGANFYVYFPILLLAGLVGPILAHFLVFSRIPIIAKFTR